jgi:hypothetical protein
LYPIEAFIAQVPEPQRTIMRRLRDRIRTADPAVEEGIKWGKPVYSLGRTSALSLVPHTRHVNLQFFQGMDIDGEGLLEGTGKAMWHVKVHSLEECDRLALGRLIAAALRKAAGPR